MSYLAFCPTGTVFTYAGTTAPNGWLLCDGTLVSRTLYAALFGVISTSNGSGDGSTTFALPDYRGRFLRGVDGTASRDPDKAGRTAASSGGNTGNAVGSVQGNATAKNALAVTNNAVTSGAMSANADHSHTTSNANIPSGLGSVTNTGSGAGFHIPVTGGTGNYTSSNANLAHTHSITSNVTLGNGDNETRPANAYVNYIIKI